MPNGTTTRGIIFRSSEFAFEAVDEAAVLVGLVLLARILRGLEVPLQVCLDGTHRLLHVSLQS